MVLPWYFTAKRGATKPQVMAVDVVSWAMVRVDWRRGTAQMPCTRIPRLQMARWQSVNSQERGMPWKTTIHSHSSSCRQSDFLPLKTWNPYLCLDWPTKRGSLRPERVMLFQLSSCGCHYRCYQGEQTSLSLLGEESNSAWRESPHK